MMKPVLAVAALLALTTLPTLAAAAETFTGKVIGVADGDTITVLRDKTPVKIRLHGVDCPEKAQPFGQQAKLFTSRLVFGKLVRVKVVTIGKYGRTVAEVFVGDKSLNEALVKAGLAWWYKQYARRAKVIALLEEDARLARRGLWSDPSPMPPWSYRHRGQPLRGNSRSRIFHAPRCRHYNCKRCTVEFKSAAQAVKAGYRPHRDCVKVGPAPPRPRSWREDRACTVDTDCVIAGDPCGYRIPPCGDARKPAVNRAADQRRRDNWANKMPTCDTRVPCKRSRGRWLGTRAACTRGQCATQP